MTKLALLAAEQRAEIVVFWALGDLDGPLSNEVKIGVCKRRAFDSQLKNMRASRARALAHRCEFYIRGEGAALRLHTAVAHRLTKIGTHIGRTWFDAGSIVAGVAMECAAIERVKLMSEDEAKALEQSELFKIIDQTGI